MPLTPNQSRSVDAEPPAQRQALRKRYLSENAQRNTAPNKPTPKQSPKPKGARPQNLPPQKQSLPRNPWAFDAFDKRHLALDERTGPYTVSNFVGHMEFGISGDKDQVLVICTRSMYPQESNNGNITDVVAVLYDASEIVSATTAILDYLRTPVAGNMAYAGVTVPTSIRGRIHNLSAHVQCLGTSTGLYPSGDVYLGTVPMLECGASAGLTNVTLKESWCENAMAVGYLRPHTATSLMQGKTAHSTVAEQMSYKTWRDFLIPSAQTTLGSLPFLTSLEPIIMYFPRTGPASGTTSVNYRVTVAQQWCTRHPNDVMLRSTQKEHKPTPPNVFAAAIETASSIGGRIQEFAESDMGKDLGSSLMSAAVRSSQAFLK
jgi:hypothetical protein